MISSRSTSLSFRVRDTLLSVAERVSAAVVVAVVLLCLGFLVAKSWPALSELDRWLTGRWQPDEGQFGLGAMLVGSALLTLGAAAIAGPLGIALAIFTSLLSPTRVSRAACTVLLVGAGLPSVVYGLWGLEVLVPFLAPFGGSGASLAAGVLTLSLMVFPSVALFAHGALAGFPRSQARAAHALGLSSWTIAWELAIPPRRAGLWIAVMLGVGRAVGETMAVLMVCGNVVQFPAGPFEPMRSLTANIALEMGYAEGTHRAMLFTGGLLLAGITLVLVMFQKRLGRSRHA